MSEHPGKTALECSRIAMKEDPHSKVFTVRADHLKDILAYVASLEADQDGFRKVAEQHEQKYWRGVRYARNAALEEAARVAEGDVDWARFGKKDIQPWEDGPDSVRDYRLGIASGRAIAVAIRQLKEGS